MKFNEKMNHKKGYRDRHPFIFKTKSPYVRKTFLYKRGTHLPPPGSIPLPTSCPNKNKRSSFLLRKETGCAHPHLAVNANALLCDCSIPARYEPCNEPWTAYPYTGTSWCREWEPHVWKGFPLHPIPDGRWWKNGPRVPSPNFRPKTASCLRSL